MRRRWARWRGSAWLWWWDLPGEHWWFPCNVLGHDMEWSVNGGGLVSWPGKIRCLIWPHSNDGYGDCCYCGGRAS